MKITNKHKTYAALLGLAFTSFGIDRLFGGAATAEATPVVAQLVQNQGETAPVIAAAKQASTASIGSQLAAMAAGRQLGSNASNAFAPSTSWIAAQQPATVQHAAQAAREFAASHALTVVVRSSHGGQAIINGQLVRLGQMIDGMKLVSIGPNSAVLSNGSDQVELRMDARL